jgi:hypothetical protein
MEMSSQLHAAAHCVGGWVGSRAGLDVMVKVEDKVVPLPN